MITWIQRYFQHHFRTVFAVLLTVTIISFVFVIGASPGIGRGDRRVVSRPYFEYDLSLPDQSLFRDALISAELQVGTSAGLEEEQIKNYALQRAAALHLANEWHIPAATTDEISAAIMNLRKFAGQDGQYDPKVYAAFRDDLKTRPRGPTAAMIRQVISDDVRADKVNKLLAGPGYVLPADVKAQLKRADTKWTVATSTADYTAFKPDIKPDDATLTKFFEENAFRYETPPRVVASYADFQSINFLASVSVNDAEVRAFYDENPARFPKPTEVKPVTDPKIPAPAPIMPDPAADFAAVRAQVEAALKLDRAQKLAVKAASDFAFALFESKIANGPALDSFLVARKVEPKPLAPFTRESGPPELGGSPEIAAEAFKLNKDRYASEAIPTPMGAAVLLWKDIQPVRKPLFAEVREKVSTDYVESEKRKRFVELGKNIKAQLEARLKAGDAFDKAVATVSSGTGVKLEAKTIPAFTLRDRPKDLDYSILGTLERLDKGAVSDMAIAADKGLLVYVADKELPDLSETNPRYTETRTQLASYTSRLGASAYISELMERELKKSEPKSE